jgi:hypothetical protein
VSSVKRHACVLAAVAFVVAAVSVTRAQQPAGRAFGPGHCGPADPAYVRVANATGGQVLPLGPNEVGAATPLMTASSGTETLLWLTNSLTTNGRIMKVPVDALTSRVSFITSTDNLLSDMVVTDPHGAPVGAGMPGVEVSAFACVRALSVDRPMAGEWNVRVSGAGTFWLTAHVKSELALDDAAFVQVAGRPGHEGLFTIRGQPIAGQPATLRTRITRAAVADARFDLVSMAGTTLQAVAMTPVSPAQSEDEFVGDIERLPTVPFRVRVSGRDRSGAAYQRISRAAFQAATIEVLGPQTVALVGGETTPVKVRIRNDGAPAQVKVTAVANATVLRVEPPTLPLATGESRDVTISVVLPAGLTSSPDIIVTAESPGNPAASNSAILKTDSAP